MLIFYTVYTYTIAKDTLDIMGCYDTLESAKAALPNTVKDEKSKGKWEYAGYLDGVEYFIFKTELDGS